MALKAKKKAAAKRKAPSRTKAPARKKIAARKKTASRKKTVRPIRRIVTGHDDGGRSIIVMDEASPHVLPLKGVPNFALTDLWKTWGAPADNTGNEDACGQPIVLEPPENGTIFRIVEFPPDREYIGKWDRSEAFASMGESGAHAMDSDSSRHEMMHRTNTVDYIFILEGEIWAIMDQGETLMRQGDVLIQRGTNHAWSNRSRKPCILGAVLVNAKPLK
jgi:hypothetical protein